MQVAASHRLLVTLEDNATTGGLGGAVLEALCAEKWEMPVLTLGAPDAFIPVSYTHLDVYKRQSPCCSKTRWRRPSVAEWTLSVSQLNEYVRRQLAGDPMLRSVRVEGEISGFKHHVSGHKYLDVYKRQ